MQFIDLGEQYRRYKEEIHTEIDRVLETTSFIKGPALKELEEQLAEHVGVKHAIGCSSGTDALVLGMMAYDIKPGDEVIVPDFTFIATAEMVSFVGAKPVFVDVRPDTYNIDPTAVEAAITDRTVGIVPVSLYGQCADMDEINEVGRRHGLWVMEDAAQSYGATYKGRKSCALSEIAGTSFFPAKPLGAYGDGGAVFTDNDELGAKLRMLLNHGQRKRYDHAMIGVNARLDTLQAAILKVKLRHFDKEMDDKRQVAAWYTEAFGDMVPTPTILDHNTSVWAQYTIRVAERERVREELKEKGIPTAVHYPIPLHRQDAFSEIPANEAMLQITVQVSREVMSLPIHPFMTKEQVHTVVGAVGDAIKEPVGG